MVPLKIQRKINDDPLISNFFPVLPSHCLMGEEESKQIAKYANEIRTVDQLATVLLPGFNLKNPPWKPLAEKLMASLQWMSRKRPPNHSPLILDTRPNGIFCRHLQLQYGQKFLVVVWILGFSNCCSWCTSSSRGRRNPWVPKRKESRLTES